MKAEEPFIPYGVQSALQSSSDLALAQKAKKGLTTEVLWQFLKKINSSKLEFEEYLPQSIKTLSRKQILDEAESERILSIMRVFDKGEDFFGNIEHFKKWLRQDNPYLGEPPMSFLKTSTGCHAILKELGRAEHGIMA